MEVETFPKKTTKLQIQFSMLILLFSKACSYLTQGYLKCFRLFSKSHLEIINSRFGSNKNFIPNSEHAKASILNINKKFFKMYNFKSGKYKKGPYCTLSVTDI